MNNVPPAANESITVQEEPYPGFQIIMVKQQSGEIAIGIFKGGVQQGPGIALGLGELFNAQTAVLGGQTVSIKMPLQETAQLMQLN